MKVLKRIGLFIGALIVLILLVGTGLVLHSNSRLAKTHTIDVRPVPIPGDPASVELGRHWATIHCTGCHGDNFEGKTIFEDPTLGFIDARNLTTGAGGVAKNYTDIDWVRAIRHGVRPDGRQLIIMPSKDFNQLSDKDLGAIIAYLKTLPPADHTTRDPSFTIPAKVLGELGAFGTLYSAEVIDHGKTPAEPVIGITAKYGEYLVNTAGCRTCHGENLSGGSDPNPEAPPGPNLTPAGTPGLWNKAGFFKTMRTGVTPEGRPLQARFMPWPQFAKFTDDELSAIWMYIHSLPKLETTK